MMRLRGILQALALTAGLLVASAPSPLLAQAGPGGAIDPNRDCQTIRRCNFGRNGSFRGCISAYSCRTCQLVAARCSIGRASSNCRQMRCNWGA